MIEYYKLRLQQDYKTELILEDTEILSIEYMEYGQAPQSITSRLIVTQDNQFYMLVFLYQRSSSPSSYSFFTHGDLTNEIKKSALELYEYDTHQRINEIEVRNKGFASAGVEFHFAFKNKYTNNQQYHLNLPTGYGLFNCDKKIKEILNNITSQLIDWLNKISSPLISLNENGVEHFEILEKT